MVLPWAQWLISMFCLLLLLMLGVVLNRTGKRIARQSWFLILAIIVVLLCVVVASLGAFSLLPSYWSAMSLAISSGVVAIATILPLRAIRDVPTQQLLESSVPVPELNSHRPTLGLIRYVEGNRDDVHLVTRLKEDLETYLYNFPLCVSHSRPLNQLVEDLKIDCKEATNVILVLSCRSLGKLIQHPRTFKEFINIVSNNQRRVILVLAETCDERIESQIEQFRPINVVEIGIRNAVLQLLDRIALRPG